MVVDSPPGGGAAYVSEVKDDSPLRNKIKLGDRITAVDGEDARGLKAIHVSSEYIDGGSFTVALSFSECFCPIYSLLPLCLTSSCPLPDPAVLLGSKSRNPQRKITVSREVDDCLAESP